MSSDSLKTRYPGVYRRPDSAIYWITWRTPDGRRHRESARTTSVKEALRLRALRVSGVATDSPQVEAGSMTIRQFAPEYLAVQKQLKSFDTLKGRVESLVTGLGDIPMESLTARDYELHRADRQTKRKPTPSQRRSLGGCKPGTMNRELATFKHLMRKARSYGYITRDALERIEGVKPLKEEAGIVRYLIREDEVALLKACIELGEKDRAHYGHLYPIVFTALRTGMRKGEILGLKREDVNLDNRIIHVTRSKSGKRRDVPIANDLREVLKKVLSGHCTEFVFWHGTGRVEAYKDVKNAFKRALRKAKITSFRFHDCRHHFASHFVMNGGNVVHLQQILGHANITMTMRYAHLAPDFVKEATRIVDGYCTDDLVTIWSRSV